jgi:uncharacterized protein (TIGR03382 family)
VTIVQVRAAEGPRAPAWPESQQVWSVVFVLIATSADPPVAEVDALRRGLTADWMAAATHPGLPGPLLISHASGEPDVPPPDAGVPDAAVPDAGAADLGLDPDGGPSDLGVPAPPAPDTGRADATPPLSSRESGCQGAPTGGSGPLAWLVFVGWVIARRRR